MYVYAYVYASMGLTFDWTGFDSHSGPSIIFISSLRQQMQNLEYCTKRRKSLKKKDEIKKNFG